MKQKPESIEEFVREYVKEAVHKPVSGTQIINVGKWAYNYTPHQTAGGISQAESHGLIKKVGTRQAQDGTPEHLFE